jgi:hypothetical protein
MGLLSNAADTAAASGAKVVTAAVPAVYSFTQLPLSSIAAAISILLSLVYMWGALPRWWKTTAAFMRGVRKGDMTEWRKLGDKPMKEED